jgi:hypothetical protein
LSRGRGGLCLLAGAPALAALVLVVALAPTGSARSASAPEKDFCVDCHGDPRFLVTNKKLYDYFQEWSSSIHRQEDVACVDCHGGNPRARGKAEGHAGGVSASAPASGIYYKNVPETCGGCHEEILEGFRESDHFENLVAADEEDQGPTCVTCHGSIAVSVLKVNSVEDACVRCHNEETGNNPEIPGDAHHILSRFLSISRFYRYITIREEPARAREFFVEIDPRVRRLAVTWHTFDLEQIGDETGEVLLLLKAKRDEIRARRARAGP